MEKALVSKGRDHLLNLRCLLHNVWTHRGHTACSFCARLPDGGVSNLPFSPDSLCSVRYVCVFTPLLYTWMPSSNIWNYFADYINFRCAPS